MSEPWKRNLPVPFFSQRENKYIWERKARNIANGGEYVDGVFYAVNKTIEKVSLAESSCNITSLCMILHYYGITTDTPDDMMRKFFEKYPAYTKEPTNWISATGAGQLTSGSRLETFLIDGYTIKAANIMRTATIAGNIDYAKDQIASGYPVWISFGSLNTNGGGSGHIAVIRGFTENDDIILNDPWGDAASPFGFLNPRGTQAGQYYLRNNPASNAGKYFGLGSGDNCVVRKENFDRILEKNAAGARYFFQTLVIKYPHLWSFPIRLNGIKTPFRFSDHTKTPEQNNEYRASQTKEMLNKETYEDSGYPLAVLPQWHDGIHIEGDSSTAVYPVGPGRLIAARVMPNERMRVNNQSSDGSNCFALARHRLNGRLDEFYSLYMHLAPIDIQAKINNMLIPSGQTGTLYEPDWIDQAIKYIRPMRAIVKSDSGIYSNENDNSLMSEKLSSASIVYLCPINDEDTRTFVENIASPEDISKFIGKLKAPETYTRNRKCAFYYQSRAANSGNIRWDIKYVHKDKIIFQPVNFSETAYYRRKLAALANGEVVTFNGEDEDSSWPAAELFVDYNGMFEVFCKQIFGDAVDFAPDKEPIDHLGRIKEKYLEYAGQIGPANARCRNVFEYIADLDARFELLARYVLCFPQDALMNKANPLTISGGWYVDSKNGFKSVYAQLLRRALYTNGQNNPLEPQINERRANSALFDYTEIAAYDIGIRNVLKYCFNDEQPLCSKIDAEPDHKEFYAAIENYYKARITISNWHEIYQTVTEKFILSSAILLNYPREKVLDREFFEDSDAWFTVRMPNAFKSLADTILKIFLARLEERMYSYMPANVDHYIEVANNTKLGVVGMYEGKNVMHFEIFSDRNIIDHTSENWENNQDNPKFVVVEDMDKSCFFNLDSIVRKLREKGFYKEENYFAHRNSTFIEPSELKAYYKNLRAGVCPAGYIIARHLYGHIDFGDDFLREVVKDRVGFDHTRTSKYLEGLMVYTWLSRDVLDAIAPNPHDNLQNAEGVFAAFYHPVRFLEWLDKKMNEQV